MRKPLTVNAEGGLVLIDGAGSALSMTTKAARTLAGQLIQAASDAEAMSMAQRQSNLLTADEAAARLDMSERTLRRIRQRGDIAYIALTDRKFRYTAEDCDAYLAACRRKDTPCPVEPRLVAGRALATRLRRDDFMEGRVARRAAMRAAKKREG